MGINSCHCYIVNLNLHQPKVPIRRKRLLYFVFESGSASSRYRHLDNSRLKSLDQCQSSMTVCSRNSYEHVDSSVSSKTYNSYALDGEEGIMTDSGQSIPKILIPSLPDEDRGENAAPITSCFWEWKPKLTVHYETSGSENVDSPAILFLPGFGVGSFHFEKQLKDLGRDYRAWALDFLGQGLSLPREDPTFRSQDGNEDMLDEEISSVWGFGDESETWAKELAFSVDLWRKQVRYFVEEVSENFMFFT